MSVSRGRGYAGRHQAIRPGDVNTMPIHTDNTNKTADASHTGVQHRNSLTDGENTEINSDDELAIIEMLKIDETYRPLISMMESINTNDDGIIFNRKLKEFENTAIKMCTDDKQLQSAFTSLVSRALTSNLSCIVSIGTALSRCQSTSAIALRTALLNAMQGIYFKVDVMERSAPELLVNAVNMMGDYFSEARLSTGGRVMVLARPLLRYFKALLNVGGMKAHRTLATQLMLNGRELLPTCKYEIEELSVNIRQCILKQPSTCAWLMLSADLCLNKFLPLPDALQQFYAKHLDLIKESQDHFSEVRYGSWKKEEKFEEEKLEESLNSNLSLSDESSEPRKPRPILGAGSKEVSSVQDTADLWNPKESLMKRYDLNSWRQEPQQEPEKQTSISKIIESAVNCKPFVPQSEPKSEERRHVKGRSSLEAPRSHKYWDHDDRCDKEYP